jgi:hypothetical protein
MVSTQVKFERDAVPKNVQEACEVPEISRHIHGLYERGQKQKLERVKFVVGLGQQGRGVEADRRGLCVEWKKLCPVSSI